MPEKNSGSVRVPYAILGIAVGVVIQIIMLAVVWGTTQANISHLQKQREEDVRRTEQYWQEQQQRNERLDAVIIELRRAIDRLP